MLRFENALWSAGVVHVAGVDEAGMSPLAGPVAAAAVIFAPGTRIPEVDDSKRLDAETARARLAPIIKQQAVAWAVAFAEVEEIDRINIYWAGLRPCAAPSTRWLAGGRAPADRRPQAARRPAAATADREAATPRACRSPRPRSWPRPRATPRCVELDAQFPGYGFARHKGYPVQAHASALGEAGRLPGSPAVLRPGARGAGAAPLPPWPTCPALEPERSTVPAFRTSAPIGDCPSVSRNIRPKCGERRACVFLRARRVPQLCRRGRMTQNPARLSPDPLRRSDLPGADRRQGRLYGRGLDLSASGISLVICAEACPIGTEIKLQTCCCRTDLAR